MSITCVCAFRDHINNQGHKLDMFDTTNVVGTVGGR